MILYLLIIAYLAICINRYDSKGIESRRGPYIFIWIVLIVLFGLQKGMGVDNLFYEQYFFDLPSFKTITPADITLGGRAQPLWLYFNAFSKSISGSYTCLQILHSLFVNIILSVFIWKFSKYRFTTVLLWFITFELFYYNIEIQREAMAVMIFCMSLKFLLEKRYFIYFALSVVAFLFHVSAVICFIFPVLYLILIKHYNSYFFWPFVIGIALLFASVESFFSVFYGGISAGMQDQYYHYQAHSRNIVNMIIKSSFTSISIIIAAVLYDKSTERNRLLFAGSIMYCVFLFVNNFVISLSRMGNYMIPMFFILLSDLTYNIAGNKKKYLVLIYIMLAISYIYSYSVGIEFLGPGAKLIDMYIPYRSIFG